MKPTILTFVRYYLPGYKSGGPVRTIANIVDHLGDDINFRIITSDRDALDDQPYHSVTIDAWNPVGKAQVYYASPGNRLLRAFTKLISATNHEVLYLNSFFDPVFTLRPLIARRLGHLPARPMIIAPRGEFSAGALAIKRWKKVPYRYLSRRAGLYRDLIWQASSEHEAKDIHAAMGGVAERVFVAPNLPPLTQVVEPGVSEDSRREDGPLQVVFLSRITPMKNLEFALRVLARVQVSVRFSIYGPIREPVYWQQCQAQMAALPSNVTVHYEGGVEPARVPPIMAAHDLFFLPTLGENYGHVILEALSAGTPVLIADTTPWRGLEKAGVGWDLPLAAEQPFVDCIHHLAGLTEQERLEFRRKVAAYAETHLQNSGVVMKNRILFMESAKGANRQS